MNPRGLSRRSFLLLARGRELGRLHERTAVVPPRQASDPQPIARPRQLRPLAPLPARASDDPAASTFRQLDGPREPGTAVALIDAALCTAWRGLPCRICREVCPVPDAIALERRNGGFVPVAGPAACRGCGLCQQQCPAEGAIRIIASEDRGDHRVRLLTPGTRGA